MEKIEITPETKAKLDALLQKRYGDYDSLISRLIELSSLCDMTPKSDIKIKKQADKIKKVKPEDEGYDNVVHEEFEGRFLPH